VPRRPRAAGVPRADWEAYRAVNQRFADAVVAEARSEDPVVLVQDYHFALLPAMIRERLPQATILTFWHIPWPNPESFGICPWRREILQGMLGSTILGFHTRYHCKNFIETVDRYLEARIEHEHPPSRLPRQGDAGGELPDLDRVAARRGRGRRWTARWPSAAAA
jgi:trehalose-6-phosphate synthase